MNRLILCSLICCSFLTAQAKVLSIEILERDTIVQGRHWGPAGPYELLQGKVFFGTDPENDANVIITDLAFTPTDEDGLVRSSADIVILKPIDQRKSDLAMVEVSNRGGKFIPDIFLNGHGRLEDPNDTWAFGDGLLLRQGVTFIWVGWQFDLPEDTSLLRFHTPIAKYPEGAPITGLVRSDWTVDERTQNLKLGHHRQVGYPAYDPASNIHKLTKRVGRNTPRIEVDDRLWDFGRIEGDQIIQDEHWIHSEPGFEAGMIYELVYHAVDPPVVGLGLAAVRDIISYAKYDSTCLFSVSKGIAVGLSQTGRFLRHFLYQGFNIDESSRQAYDGMLIIIAGAGRGSFNHRFAQPSRDAHRYSAFFYPTDLFPFTGRRIEDKMLRIRGGLLDKAPNHQPKIFYVNTGYEYWGRAASLIHTSPDGAQDIPPLPNERIYHVASAQHYVPSFPPEEPYKADHHLYLGNPLQFKPNLRALFTALYDWVATNTTPPANRFPTITSGELTAIDGLSYPTMPGFERAKVIHEAYRADYGASFTDGIITKQPPRLRDAYVSLAPQVDQLGNEISGIRNVELLVPLASYIPYAIRRGFAGGNGELHLSKGTFIPLSKTPNANDARMAISDLYNDKNDYMLKVRNAAESLVADRFLLKEDIHRVSERASSYWSWIHGKKDILSSDPIEVMTFNIRYDNPKDGVSAWPNRKDFVVALIEGYDPDFLGLQEALHHQCRDVRRGIKGYRWIGVGREDGDKKGEFAPIFYQKKDWELLNSGHFWLSSTPEKPSVGWDAALERIATWGKFKHRDSDKEIFVFNTHFDHRGEQARLESIKLLREKIQSMTAETPFLLMGDFNFDTQSEPYLWITEPRNEFTIVDSKVISENIPQGPPGTFSGFVVTDNLPQRQIDHIFVDKDTQVLTFEIIAKSRDGRYPSDHFPVFTQIVPKWE
ncbi:MAG: endonuclease/exonuclease/phosphatase family protein [Saprospiraceae bacterium]|nr:endonuclease/exonuclease/phosphatase family protein [Saprospiraceae bacterium]